MPDQEIQFGTGAIADPIDERDYPFDVLTATAPVVIDWVKGYDIRNEIGDFVFKNQWSSGSCVGQGWSYYLAVLNAIETGVYDNCSAKAIYSQIFLNQPGGGAYIRDGAKLICDWGGLKETVVPSNRPDGTTDEAFMRDLSWKDSLDDVLAKVLQGKDYRVIVAVQDMDLFAQAILQNKGVVAGVYGENNGTWTSERPQPPKSMVWGHCLYFGAFGQDEFGKYVAFPNSWGNLLGKTWKAGDPPGYGWQKIYLSYFAEGGKYLFNPWTFTDKPNVNSMQTNVKVIKDENSPAVGFWCPANNPEGLIAMARNYGIEIPKKADGGIDWDALIQGTLTLK